MHTLSLSFGLAFAIAGLPLTLYNNAQTWCWIMAEPIGCTESWRSDDGTTTCRRGDNATIYQYVFNRIPIWITFLIATVAMVMVYDKVFKEEKSGHYDGDDEEGGRSCLERPAYSLDRIRFFLGSFEEDSGNDGDGEDPKRKLRRTRRVVTQAALYLFSGYLTWIFPTINRIIQLAGGVDALPYGMLVCQAIFTPMQGWWNFLVCKCFWWLEWVHNALLFFNEIRNTSDLFMQIHCLITHVNVSCYHTPQTCGLG
jgi:hypothetical protein